jgi:hypothetical protein
VLQATIDIAQASFMLATCAARRQVMFENLSAPNLIGGLLFGAVGFVAFIYGKRQSAFRAMGFGVALMAFPYFVSNTLALYGIGTALTAALFVFRD